MTKKELKAEINKIDKELSDLTAFDKEKEAIDFEKKEGNVRMVLYP
jgi:hypothetical protein